MGKLSIKNVMVFGLLISGVFGAQISRAETLTVEHVTALKRQEQKYRNAIYFYTSGRNDSRIGKWHFNDETKQWETLFDRSSIVGLLKRANEIAEFINRHEVGTEVENEKLAQMLPRYQSASPASSSSSSSVSARSDSGKDSLAAAASSTSGGSPASASGLTVSVENSDEATILLPTPYGVLSSSDFSK